MKLRKLTLCAILTATALVMFLIEAQIPALTPIPGIKPGLSNIVTIFSLYTLGGSWTLLVLLSKVVLGSLLTGQASAILYSLAGGIPALGLSYLLKNKLENRIWVLSVFSAMTHNLGQLLCAVLVTGTPTLFVYLPILWISAIVSGAFTGTAAQAVLRRLRGQTEQ